jgi:excisionase family DNA binding protein
MATAKRDLTNPPVQGPQPDGERLLTLQEVAEQLQVTVTYVRRHLLFEYRLPYVALGARTRRVRQSDLDVFIATRRVTPSDYPVAKAQTVKSASRGRARR